MRYLIAGVFEQDGQYSNPEFSVHFRKLLPEIMSHVNPGLLSAYNSLTDKHLTGYFNNTRIRRHLQRVGLITRSGRIVPDKEYRIRVMQKAHQRNVRECLAQAVFHKVLHMERLHQIEIKRKLEDFARRERVHKMKVERSKRYEDDVIQILSPRPPTGPRVSHALHSGPEGEHSESSESPGSSRPNTAPGKMQRPVRLKPINSSRTRASKRHTFPYRPQDGSHHTEQPFNCTIDKEPRRQVTVTESSPGVSPYRLPVINNFVTPVPPPPKKKERGGFKGTPTGTLRGRRLRPTTAPNGLNMTEDLDPVRTSVQSKVCVSMVYFGKTVHLSHDLMDLRDEVKVFQQHCGGENLCVFRGRVQEAETFQFVSRRHRGFPFSLTFFLNGLQVERLSSCCEFKHRKGSRLGGRNGHFGFSKVEGASPCYRCIIAMGLDKKPTPPPKRIKEDIMVDSPSNTGKGTAGEEEEKVSCSQPEPETIQAQNMETVNNEDKPSEDDKPKDDYDEDFEADEEDEDGHPQKEKNFAPASREREEDQQEIDDHSDVEDYEKDEQKRSMSGSSSSGSERDDSEADDEEDQTVKQGADIPKNPEEEALPQAEQEKDTVTTTTSATIAPDSDQQPTEDGTDMETSSPTPPQTTPTGGEDTGTLGDSPRYSVGRTTELEVSGTSAQSERDGKGDEDRDEAEGEEKERVAKVKDKSTLEEEELERAKSVQDKLVEAIFKEIQSHSEPELSDSSTETEEDPTEKTQQRDTAGVEPEKNLAFTLQQKISTEEVNSGDNSVNVAIESFKNEEGDISTVDYGIDKVEEVSHTEEYALKDKGNTEEEREEEEAVQTEDVKDADNPKEDRVKKEFVQTREDGEKDEDIMEGDKIEEEAAQTEESDVKDEENTEGDKVEEEEAQTEENSVKDEENTEGVKLEEEESQTEEENVKDEENTEGDKVEESQTEEENIKDEENTEGDKVEEEEAQTEENNVKEEENTEGDKLEEEESQTEEENIKDEENTQGDKVEEAQTEEENIKDEENTEGDKGEAEGAQSEENSVKAKDNTEGDKLEEVGAQIEENVLKDEENTEEDKVDEGNVVTEEYKVKEETAETEDDDGKDEQNTEEAKEEEETDKVNTGAHFGADDEKVKVDKIENDQEKDDDKKAAEGDKVVSKDYVEQMENVEIGEKVKPDGEEDKEDKANAEEDIEDRADEEDKEAKANAEEDKDKADEEDKDDKADGEKGDKADGEKGDKADREDKEDDKKDEEDKEDKTDGEDKEDTADGEEKEDKADEADKGDKANGEQNKEDKENELTENRTGDKWEEEVLKEKVVDLEEELPTSEIHAHETKIQEDEIDQCESYKESESAQTSKDSTEERNGTLLSRDETNKKDNDVETVNGEVAAALEAQSETARECTESTSHDPKDKENSEGVDTAVETGMEAETNTDELNQVDREEEATDQEAIGKWEGTKLDHKVNGDKSKEEAMAQYTEGSVDAKKTEESEETRETSEQNAESKDIVVDSTLES
uniref:DUF4590 domain-containing protein n=2 Tax=Esox lucius TaxID=8010 RepID=A0A3P9A727_ESOLU